MTHASARQDMNNYITSRASFTADQQPGIYHGAQIATPQTASFGHSMPPVGHYFYLLIYKIYQILKGKKKFSLQNTVSQNSVSGLASELRFKLFFFKEF